MKHEPPALLAQFMKAAPGMGPTGEYLMHCFGAFDFNGITPKLPTTTFSGRMPRKVGDKTVELIEIGPAHTGGDTLVHVPAERIAVNVATLYREFAGATTSPNPAELFALMGEFWKKRRD